MQPGPTLTAQTEIHRELRLIDIAPQCRHRDAIARRDEDIGQINSAVGPMPVLITQAMRTGPERRHIGAQLQPDRTVTASNSVGDRETPVAQLEVKGLTVDLKADRVQDHVRVRLRLRGGHRAAPVGVHLGKDRVRDRNPGR